MCNNHFPSSNYKKLHDINHDKEHSHWSRRSFIQALGLMGGGTVMLGGTNLTVSRPSPLAMALTESENDNILVIIRLKGGNDGLNTIVPVYDYDTYAGLRPNIRLAESSLYALDADFGLPEFMSPLQSVWGNGSMKVVHGVGYPDQNFSHFESSDIWANTNTSDPGETGWWGRYFEELYPDYLVNPPAVPPAIQIGSIGNLIFDGLNSNYAFTVANPDQLSSIASTGVVHDVTDIPECYYGDQLQFLRAATNTTFAYASVINEAYEGATNDAPYDTRELSNQLAIIARLIKGGLGTKVFMVTLGGFDTHANQLTYHNEIMNDLSLAVKNFYDDLATAGWDDKVLSMTISEFGRRPFENGSLGTDHGSASTMMLFGSGLNGSGFVGSHPSLTATDPFGNLIFNQDFRNIYASILIEWMCIDETTVNSALLNTDFEMVDLGFACSTASVNDFEDVNRFAHTATYRDSSTFINFNMPFSAHVKVVLYNIVGQEVATLTNDMKFAGAHEIDVKNAANTRLHTGQYIYRISIGDQHFSKSIVIR